MIIDGKVLLSLKLAVCLFCSKAGGRERERERGGGGGGRREEGRERTCEKERNLKSANCLRES